MRNFCNEEPRKVADEELLKTRSLKDKIDLEKLSSHD
jgi:hypothetical protein